MKLDLFFNIYFLCKKACATFQKILFGNKWRRTHEETWLSQATWQTVIGTWEVWRNDSSIGCVNEVSRHRERLLPRWVTVRGLYRNGVL